jgi:phosphate transport system substrate-binding protein
MTRGLALLLIAGAIACGPPSIRAVRVTGSDTMVNLVQAWAEDYGATHPGISVQVGGGGSGVGIAGLIDGTLDLAAASREMRADERTRAAVRHGAAPREILVGLDAIAVYVHRTNPLDAISIVDLAEIYGERGTRTRWSQMGIRNPRCRSDAIVRVGRQNNSGTYAAFRDLILGGARDYALGSIDQNGSKDVVALVANTPCAIGYSSLAFATPGVKALAIRSGAGAAVRPDPRSVLDGSYPFARRLYLYAAPGIPAHVSAFVEWVLGREGQGVVRAFGLVPVPPCP